MEARDEQSIKTYSSEVSRALTLLSDSLTRSPVRAEQLPDMLPRAAYWLGVAVAGSRPGLSRTPAAAIADALGMLDAIREGTRAAYAGAAPPPPEAAAAVARIGDVTEAFRIVLEPALVTGQLAGRAGVVVSTGWLGVALRAALSPLGKPWVPYSPRVFARGHGQDEPLSVLTVPDLTRGSTREPAEEERLAALGEKLFSDRTLSAGARGRARRAMSRRRRTRTGR